MTPKLLPDRIGEDVIVGIGITSDELVLLLGRPHQVLVGKTPSSGFSFLYFTSVDCYAFFFTRERGNKDVLYAIHADGGY